MKYRYDQTVTAESVYPPGSSGSPNVYHFKKIPTYYRIYRCTFTTTIHGNTSVSHSWTCEQVGSLARVCTGHKSWQEAIDYACWLERGREKAVA